MFGSVIMALISGILMSVQGVFNTRVTEKAGIWFTTGIVNFTGFLLCILILLFVRDENVAGLKHVNKLYLLGGVIGACITYTVIIAIGSLGPAYAVMLILIAQTLSAYLIELFGLFQTEKSPFVWSKLVGVGVMIVGIIIFQWKH
ncbi:DMT family transporter [Cellulosilyticum ruminicola]|uniref:DMT family transporter n=1 Tax=Cellulosilyticum ruminicola TaxID=425254 RepID=UPI0006D179DC|nr:DMT family transporter [Cellulosilyticum ruminicola]